MLRDMGTLPQRDLPALEVSSREYFAAALVTGEYCGWLIEAKERVVAGGGLILRRLLPRPDCIGGGDEAHIFNMYTEPDHRRCGYARALMETMLVWCRAHDIKRVSLHASSDGVRLYESLGFAPTNEMRLMANPFV
ncbi:MAG: GNAT family N-acetyltransferase [Deltaproteobacteria bacterium]|nr:GNAT family N-acetyltransferase [Deltaproteobacteria bacterium]MBI3390960.1 GNAT family N-acetyltransferase [Deltaproteobacteria bacterium]